MRWRVALIGLNVAAALACARGALAATASLGQVEAQQAQREQDRDIARATADAARSDLAGLQAQLSELNLAASQGERSVSDKRLRLAAINAREADLKAKLGGEQSEM